jgi:O-antigen ligase
MLTGILLGLGWLAFVIFVILALNGWLANFFYALKVVIGALADVACQAWIDTSRLFRSRKNRHSKYWNDRKSL